MLKIILKILMLIYAGFWFICLIIAIYKNLSKENKQDDRWRNFKFMEKRLERRKDNTTE